MLEGRTRGSKKSADVTRCALLSISTSGIQELPQPYAHEEVRVESATTVATSLPASEGEPNDVSPRNFFNHSLKSLLDLRIGSCVCQPFIRPFLYECSNSVSNRG